MSQFSFPRINFSGQVIIDVATGNNDDYQPGLIMFDPVTNKAEIPPLVYVTFNTAIKWNGQDFTLSGNAIQEKSYYIENYNAVIQTDPDIGQEYCKIPIDVINNDNVETWYTTPLGDLEVDKKFHDLYRNIAIGLTKDSSPMAPGTLIGVRPGEWNYYGSMEVVMDDLKVTGIVMEPAADGSQEIYTPGDSATDPIIPKLLTGSLNAKNLNGSNTAIMADINPLGVSASQIICDAMTFQSGKSVLFSGNPTKTFTRWIHFGRVLESNSPPEGASGTFFCGIPLSAMAAQDKDFINFLKSQTPDGKILKGVFIRYNLYEVIEDRRPYQNVFEKGNPATSTMFGTIAPWYEGEMHTVTPGRILNPFQRAPFGPIMTKTAFDANNAPQYISMDLVNSLNEIQVAGLGKWDYNLVEIGTLSLVLKKDSGNVTLGSINIPGNFNRAKYHELGGTVDFTIAGKVSKEDLANNDLAIYFDIGDGKEPVQNYLESEYFITSEEAALYGEQGDDSGLYVDEGYPTVPCILRIFRKGQPVTTPIDIYQQEFKPNQYFFMYPTIPGAPTKMKDGDRVILSTEGAGIRQFLFATSINQLSDIGNGLPIGTGYYINIRILPDDNHLNKYLRKRHPVDITFEVLQKEIFDTYTHIYPLMSRVLAFTKENWNNGTMAGMLVFRTSENEWHSYLYMPRTRELSAKQRALIQKWAKDNFNVDPPTPPARIKA